MNIATAASDNCKSILARNEYRAWQSARYCREALELPKMPIGLKLAIDTTVLPVLTQIGMDASFARALIQIAMPAWEKFGRTSNKIQHIDPKARSDVAEVEQGLLHRAQKTYDMYFLPSRSSSPAFFEMVDLHMHPRNLFDLLEDVSTPWIILPRAFRFLEKEHCRYLPLYLDMLMRSTHELCIDKWIRITIEFMANYAIKFADDDLPIENVIDLVIHGYEAMFWHTLKDPPTGFEDNRIFEHYLGWMCHSDALGPAPAVKAKISEATGRMASGIQSVFPNGNAFQKNEHNPDDMPCMHIALRHGCLGIVSTGRYFWAGPLLICGKAGQVIDYKPVLLKLRNLFYRIRTDYPHETRRTQYFIRDFLHQFEAAYKGIKFPIEGSDEFSNNGIQFLVAQILQTICRLRRSIERL